MNKGWHLAQGRYVQYLNAGDVFASDDEAAWAVARFGTPTHTTNGCEREFASSLTMVAPPARCRRWRSPDGSGGAGSRSCIKGPS